MKTLVVVDMQNDFITGSLGSEEAQAIVPNVVEKMRKYYEADDFVITTLDTHGANYFSTQEGMKLPIEHCIQGTEGWLLESSISELIDSLRVDKTYRIFKNSFGTLRITDLITRYYLERPKKILESIEFVGVCTDICVISNAIICKSEFPDVPIIVDASCCAGSTIENHQKALDLMKNSLQIDVIND